MVTLQLKFDLEINI